ncbi:MAG: VacJ family lipoprotein [Paracoccaceae bacterium]|nr:VacJ family lipoprotein [Paracoccaceae bacterium]
MPQMRSEEMFMKIRLKNQMVVFHTRARFALEVIGKTLAMGGVLALTACASPEGLESIHDPYETVNRKTHDLNKGLDRILLKPVSNVYSEIVPDVVGVGISNFSKFLDLPGEVVNNVLQFDLGGAAKNTARFVINGTVGVLGLYDAASEVGIYPSPADFGQTLHVWGVGEGAYLELPVVGGSTGRDTTGIVVDAFLNPMSLVLTENWRLAGSGVKTVALIGDRARFATTVDLVLYESADSYSQSRLFYLQSRRHELGMRLEEEDYYDPYEDLYE